MSRNADEVDVVAIVRDELVADPTMPEALKVALLELAASMRVRRRTGPR